MVYLEINPTNYSQGNPSLIKRLNRCLTNENCHLFILFYMEGCGPCNATRPEWSKLKNVLPANILNSNNIFIVQYDQSLISELKNITHRPLSFPTMRYITKAGKISENYEDSPTIINKDRSIDSFIQWINYYLKKNLRENNNNVKITDRTSRKSRKKKYENTRNTRNTIKMYGGKWSLKYKKSINCKKPKGFSQKQYCKYGRKTRKTIR